VARAKTALQGNHGGKRWGNPLFHGGFFSLGKSSTPWQFVTVCDIENGDLVRGFTHFLHGGWIFYCHL